MNTSCPGSAVAEGRDATDPTSVHAEPDLPRSPVELCADEYSAERVAESVTAMLRAPDATGADRDRAGAPTADVRVPHPGPRRHRRPVAIRRHLRPARSEVIKWADIGLPAITRVRRYPHPDNRRRQGMWDDPRIHRHRKEPS
jgi:hypothetical protein